jgi:3-hydroxyisobutyrate dehydrogenase-like beta-hydroxyacid dehydrogenase
MKTIAIIGTGIMGSGMAANYLKKGYPVVVWNRSPDKLDPLLALGARRDITPRQAAAEADIIFEITADDESSRAVWLGDDGILAGIVASKASEKFLIASGTFSVNWIDELAGLCVSRKLTFLDIPVTGGRSGAEGGTLTLLAGGYEEALNRLKPDLAPISEKMFRFGPPGSGARFKLLLNFLYAVHLSAFGEAMKIARQAGLDEKSVGEFFVKERPGGTTTKLAWDMYGKQPDPINFSMQWMEKDLRYGNELAGGLDVKLLNATLAKFKKALDEGRGDEDWTTINK